MTATDINITADLMKWAAAAPRKPALVIGSLVLTYAQLDRAVWAGAHALHEKGLRPGDRAGLRCEREGMRALLSLSVMRLGASLMPVPRSLTAYQADQLQQQAGLSSLITDISGFEISGIETIRCSPQDFRSPPTFSQHIYCETPGHPCLVIQGSGSTGRPKIIALSHAQLNARCGLAYAAGAYREEISALSLTNLEFASGLNRLLSTLKSGGVFILPGDSPASLASLCATHAVTTLFSSVFHTEQILRSDDPATLKALRSLTSLRLSGSTISKGLRCRIRDHLTPNLHIVYGANECGRITFGSGPEIFGDGFSVGRALPGAGIEVRDDKGQPLPPGHRGHIAVKTGSVIDGYVGDTVASRRHFRDGWFLTGDLGELTSEGWLRHFGRSDDMIIYNGINIYPVVAEQFLKDVRGVTDAAVISLHHPVHQDVPVAFVSLEAGVTLDATYLRDHLRAHLGVQGVHSVRIVPAIPRNANGKLQRALLTPAPASGPE